jgi:hypothetical protein
VHPRALTPTQMTKRLKPRQLRVFGVISQRQGAKVPMMALGL